jgi:hypothetical protein
LHRHTPSIRIRHVSGCFFTSRRVVHYCRPPDDLRDVNRILPRLSNEPLSIIRIRFVSFPCSGPATYYGTLIAFSWFFESPVNVYRWSFNQFLNLGGLSIVTLLTNVDFSTYAVNPFQVQDSFF